MELWQLIVMLKTYHPKTEIRVPYGDEPGENGYVTAGIMMGDNSILLTAVRAEHEMRGNDVLWVVGDEDDE